MAEARFLSQARICVPGHVFVDPIKHNIVGGDFSFQNYLTLDSLTERNKKHHIITAGDV